MEHLLAVIPQATFLYLKVALGANAPECVNGNDKNWNYILCVFWPWVTFYAPLLTKAYTNKKQTRKTIGHHYTRHFLRDT